MQILYSVGKKRNFDESNLAIYLRTKKNTVGTYIKNILTQEERINVIKQVKQLDCGKLCRQLTDELGVEKNVHTERS